MKILFHAPALSAHRPDIPLPLLSGVPPAAADSLAGLAPAHQITGNRGNIIHAEAPARMLRKSAAGSALGNLAALQRALGSGFREKMAEHFDIIVFSLANFIRPSVDGARLYAALKALDGAVPFVVLGAGMQGKFAFSDLQPGNRDLLALLNEQAALFGVRGPQTAGWLAENGLQNTTILGCPSLYVYPQSILAIDGAAARARGAAANVMTAGHLSIRDGEIVERGSRLAEAFQGIEASYVFQDEFFDYGPLAAGQFGYNEGNSIARPDPLNRWLSQKCGVPVNFSRYYYFAEAGAWRQAAMLHDVYIGDRFHGGVAALQAGQPAIFLKHDNRVTELTGHVGLPALRTQKFAKMGLAAVLEEYLSDERLAEMKALYRQRHAEFTAALAPHGLVVEPIVPAEGQPVPAISTQASPPAQAAARVQARVQASTPEASAAAGQGELTGEEYVLRRSGPQRARELVVSFEGAAGKPGGRSPERQGFGARFLAKGGYAVLSVLPQRDNWYQAPELAGHFASPQMQQWLQGFERIHCLGSGMGAFGAMAYAGLLQAETVVALQPVTSLAADLVPQQAGFAAGRKLDWSGPFRDGCAGLASAARIYAIHGGEGSGAADGGDPHLARLAQAAGARLHAIAVAGSGAGVARHLRRDKRLAPVVLACLQGAGAAEAAALAAAEPAPAG